ncbi:MAG: FtsQ-type POTRA domain-containing protein [bacterium]|nr:FtsQ-type POTRA domain-containing protein [bacterium]
MPSRSEARRRARNWAVGSLVALVVTALTAPLWSGPMARLLAAQVKASSRHFRVQEVVVRGLRAVPEREILELAGISCGTPLYSVSTAAAKRRIKTHPWIRFACVRRRLPDTVEIRVTEREPVAALRGSELLMITTDSMVVAPLAGGRMWDLPLLTPPRPLKLRAGTALKDAATMALLRQTLLVRSVSRDAWRNLSEIYMSGDDLHATLANPTVDLVLGQGAGELAWAAALELLRSRPRNTSSSIQSMDLRVPGRIVVIESSSTVEEQVRG